MEDQDFFYVGKDNEQGIEIFINLATITKMQWDGKTMNVFSIGSGNTYVYGETGERLRDEVMRRCANKSRSS
jgi:hypothetical protein